MCNALSNLYLPLIYKFGRDWWIVFWLSIALSLLSFFPLLFFVKESPKFFVSVGRFASAREVYSFIAKVNNKPMFFNKLEGEEAHRDSEKKSLHGIKELCQIKSLRVSLFVVPLNWFAVSLIALGLTFSLGNL